MTDEIQNSQLIQAGADEDAEFVALHWGDALGENHMFELTFERFEHAMQQLTALSDALRATRKASVGLGLSVPLPAEEASASASLGGDVVFLDIRAEGSARKTTYSLSAKAAMELGKQLIAESGDAASQKDAPRH